MSSDDVPTTATIATHPTNETSTHPEPLPSKPQPHTALLQRLYILLRRYIASLARSTDRNILRLSKLLSTPSGTDVLLCTVGYTLGLLSTLATKYLQRSAIATPTSKTSDVVVPPVSSHVKRLLGLSAGSKVIASTISDYRIFVRLWGLVGVYSWARSTYCLPPISSSTPTMQKLLRGITWTQVGAGVAFQVLENGAYLASKGAIWTSKEGKRRETRWWVWSSRFWAAHVGLEFARLYIESRQLRNKRNEGMDMHVDGEKEEETIRDEQKKQAWGWWRDAVSNAAYAPMTLHWSVEEGLLSELAVGVLGAVAGGSLLVDKWSETR